MEEKTVLIVTPYPDLGDLLRQSICKSKPWNINSVSTVKAVADAIFNYCHLDYALVDMDHGFEKVRDIIFIIRDKFPLTQLVLLSKCEPPEEAEELRPWKLLSKPFIESDLMEIFSDSTDFQMDQVIDGKFTDLPADGIPLWARDKDQVTNILTNAIANLDIQEAIIFVNNDILAHTENMEPSDISDCSFIKYKYLEANGQGELIKQVHLTSNKYLLHMTILAVGIILAVLYNPDTSYNIVRNQTRYITMRIVNPQLSSSGPSILPDYVLTMEKERSSQHQLHGCSVDINRKIPGKVSHPRPARKFKRGKMLAVDNGSEDLDEPDRLSPEDLKALWSFSVPEPDPGIPFKPSDKPTTITGLETGECTSKEYKVFVSQDQEDDKSDNGSIANVEKGKNRIPLNLPAPAFTQLNFTCMLIPRIKSHGLIGDIARCLNEEVPTIFLAYAWRLESLIISKQFMQWSVAIPASIAPSNHIKTIRKESSKLVLGNFSRLSRDGLITDFWAPGFLLESGKCQLSGDVIAEFIQANRQQYYPDERVYQIPEASFMAN